MALYAAALIVQPSWGCVFAGIGAGGALGASFEGTAMASFGVGWNVAIVCSAIGLLDTATLLAARVVRIFPGARRAPRARAVVDALH